MEIIVTSMVEIRTRVNSAANVSQQQVNSSGLYMSINRTIQTEQTPVSACFSLSQPQNTQKKNFTDGDKTCDNLLFPAGFEPTTVRVLGGRDYHYTTKKTCSGMHRMFKMNLFSNKLTNKQNLEGAVGTGSVVSVNHLFLTPVAYQLMKLGCQGVTRVTHAPTFHFKVAGTSFLAGELVILMRHARRKREI